MRNQFNRRALLQAGVAGGASLVAFAGVSPDADAAANVSVLCMAPPDHAPPGVAEYARALFAAWQIRRGVTVSYDPVAWPQMHRRIERHLTSEPYVFDLIAMAGWTQEFSGELEPLDELLPTAAREDLAPSALASSSWEGRVYGCPTTLSLLTLHYNLAHFEQVGLASPPKTWDELRRFAMQLTRDGRAGWVCPYGTAGGIGGLASTWIVFLQQAGGRLFDEFGMPAFGDGTGVDAIQFMIDLMPSTHGSAFEQTGVVDATVAFMRGEASMMMNWPFMWRSLQNRKLSSVAAQVGTAILPAGLAGTASIDSGDTWTLPRKARQKEQAMALVGFYLDKRVQRAQALESDWLPARQSVLKEAAIQAALPHAATVAEQAQHPFNAFLTPDYERLTTAIGLHLARALHGRITAAEAIDAALDDMAEIVKQRAG